MIGSKYRSSYRASYVTAGSKLLEKYSNSQEAIPSVIYCIAYEMVVDIIASVKLDMTHLTLPTPSVED